jgi:DNA-binding NtrC family response regulator
MPSAPLPILIADDQRDVLEALRLLLKSEGHACRTVAEPAAALEAVKTNAFAAALIDLNYTRDTTSGTEGLELLRALKRADPDLPVVVMTAWGSIHLAVEAMREGAGDFVEKPWDNARLVSILRNQVALGEALRRESAWPRTIACCRARTRISSPARAPCSRCSTSSRAWRPPTPTCWCWARTAPARAWSRA